MIHDGYDRSLVIPWHQFYFPTRKSKERNVMYFLWNQIFLVCPFLLEQYLLLTLFHFMVSLVESRFYLNLTYKSNINATQTKDIRKCYSYDIYKWKSGFPPLRALILRAFGDFFKSWTFKIIRFLLTFFRDVFVVTVFEIPNRVCVFWNSTNNTNQIPEFHHRCRMGRIFSRNMYIGYPFCCQQNMHCIMILDNLRAKSPTFSITHRNKCWVDRILGIVLF